MSPLLNLSHLGKSYPCGDDIVAALTDINLTVSTGEFTALKGPSGSGKSTLLNICGLLDQHDSGQLSFNGIAVEGMDEAQKTQLRRDHIGFVFQGFNLIPIMTVYENVEYPLLLTQLNTEQRRQRVTQILDQVGLSDHAHKRPDHISGGQRQRVAIARALVKHPPLVIADEPTANLDSASATQVIDLMRQLGHHYNATFLIATHDERMTQRCDRVLNLVDGQLTDATEETS